MIIEFFKKFDPYKNIFTKDENNREINIYRFENCVPTGVNLFYPNVLFKPLKNSIRTADLYSSRVKTDETLVLPLVERTMSLQSGTIYEKMNMDFDAPPPPTIQHHHEDPLFFFIYNTDNYFHFLYDSLPYLISYLQLKQEIPELKLLMQFPNEQKKSFYPFVLELLEILTIQKGDIVLIDPHTEYKTIYVSTSYTHDIDSNLPPRKEIYSFYQEMVQTVKRTYPFIETPQKFYVSRRSWMHRDVSNIGTNYTTRRKLVNEDELVEKLVTNGFTEVFTEKLTTVEKILYFANATHIVGAIGGGISNVLFSPSSTKLEALVSPTFLNVNKRFVYTLDCVDVLYNTNTEHVEKGAYRTYMRVKTKDGTIVGEIEKIGHDNTLLISYTDGSNTGWNAQYIYRQIQVNQSDVIPLDDGLNSFWKFDISTLHTT